MTLEAMLRLRRPVRLSLALSILRQCARELDAAHASGLVHGALTPARILVSDPAADGAVHAEIQDYGIGRPEQQNVIMGLAPPDFTSYMAPEEILGSPADSRSDEFSLAVIAYELLCGRKPFQSKNISELFFEICSIIPPPPELFNSELTPESGVIVQHALAKDPTRRFPSCNEFVEMLESSIRLEAPVIPPPVVIAPEPVITELVSPGPTFIGQPTAPPVVDAPAAPPVVDAPAAPPVVDLPPARRRVHAGEEPDEPVRAKPRSGILTFGLIALAVIAVVALGARLLNWRAKPSIPVQVLDTNAGPATPPPAPAPSEANPQTPPAQRLPQPVRQQPPTPSRPRPQTVPVFKRQPAPAAAKVPAVRTLPDLAPRGGVADIDLLTQPPGARIVVDNRPDMTCTSPCTLVLPNGRHVLSTQLPGFAEARRIFHVPDDSSLLIALSRTIGTLLVTSTPPGATLLVDGQNAGRTPTTLRLTPGQHRLDAFFGSQAQQKLLQIEPDAIQATTFDLRNR